MPPSTPLILVTLVTLMTLVVTGLSAPAAHAVELSSPNYRHLAGSVGSVASVGADALVSSVAQPDYQGSDVNVGMGPTVAPSGSLATLASIMPGFLTVALGGAFSGSVGGFPTLDLDGDLAQFFLDEDDDGDGIDDIHETGTGFFVSVS